MNPPMRVLGDAAGFEVARGEVRELDERGAPV